MRIGIFLTDGSVEGGVATYHENLLSHLIPLCKEDQLFLFRNNKTSKPSVTEVKLPFDNQLICELTAGPLINSLHLDVLLCTMQTKPLFTTVPSAVVIHDISCRRRVESFSLENRIRNTFLLPLTCRQATHFITVSKSTCQEVHGLLKVPKEKITIAQEGPPQKKRYSQKELLKIKKRYELPNSFFLYAGAITPRKNLRTLLKALEHLPEAYLVLTGGVQKQSSSLVKMINKNPQVHLLGHVPRKDLVALYKLALAFVYPSLYEGFGLPVLESQANGCPVITTTETSLPEVAGEAALYFAPFDVKKLSEHMITVQDRAVKKRLCKKGFDNIKRFSWSVHAKTVYSLLRQIGSQ
ncbi:glycosyltransferase [Candidatus Woesearchaeota archaeon]|nr:glycosyltransferase [Candidatus Woesearchaeota archaeon]